MTAAALHLRAQFLQMCRPWANDERTPENRKWGHSPFPREAGKRGRTCFRCVPFCLGNGECPLSAAYSAGEHDAHRLLDREIRLRHAPGRAVRGVAADLVAHG